MGSPMLEALSGLAVIALLLLAYNRFFISDVNVGSRLSSKIGWR
jgi:hypothetical protein